MAERYITVHRTITSTTTDYTSVGVWEVIDVVGAESLATCGDKHSADTIARALNEKVHAIARASSEKR